MNEAKKFQKAIQKDPPGIFYDKVLGCGHYDIQDEITRSVFNNQRTTVRSCHGSGKSYTAARVGNAFLFAFPNSIVLNTAPTFRQVKDVYWKEWHVAHQNSKTNLGGKLLDTQYEINKKWYAKGISSDRPDNVQGYHAEHVLLIVDEPPGVPHNVLEATQGILTSSNVRVLYIGNPTVGSGPFYDSHHGRVSEFWNKIKISVFDTPNFKKNGIHNLRDLKKFKTREEVANLPLAYSALVTPLWAWERMEEWGEDSPIFQARVLAEFPSESEYTLIGLCYVQQAIERKFDHEEKKQWPHNGKSIGIDVARYGSNATVLCAMNRKEMLDIDWHQGKNTMETVGKAIAMFKELGFNKKQDYFVVDDTGVGGGVTDRLREQGYNVIAVNFGANSNDERFFNLKAEIFWNLRDFFLSDDISIIDKGKLASQLPTIEYEYTSNGKLKIVSKEKMMSKGIESPDFADALALAVWVNYTESGGYVYTGNDDFSGDTLAGNLLNQEF
jgi:phage terminase large subunit